MYEDVEQVYVAQDRVQLQVFVDTVMKLQVY